MTLPYNPEDRPDAMENMPAVRARIPEHVAKGEISTGVIVVTGGTEYLLDFVRNLPRPSCVVARVVLPHLVMPQFIDALSTNIELFRQRYGDLPGTIAPVASVPVPPADNLVGGNAGATGASSNPAPDATGAPLVPVAKSMNADSGVAGTGTTGAVGSNPLEPSSIDVHAGGPVPVPPPAPAAPNPNAPRRQNPQDVYDELKLRDEILSGAYANAVMIGHGPYEFSFDFITNFYPQSAVSCRVYMASGHILRLLESLKASWEQLRPRYGYPPKS